MPAKTYAHTVTVRRSAAGPWIVTHSWQAENVRGWLHGRSSYPTAEKATRAAERLRRVIRRGLIVGAIQSTADP